MDNSKQKIMEATCSALHKHGYSDLSIQKIADEFEKSKSLLYHHYDGKDDLLLDFMDFMLEKFREDMEGTDNSSLRDKFFDLAFMGFNEECKDSLEAFVELRAAGIQDRRFRDKFEEFSKAYRNKLEKIMKEGYDQDLFKEINAERVSNFIDSVNKEAIFQKASNKDIEPLEGELEFYIKEKILKQF